MDCDRIVFSGHAVKRMFERKIRLRDVETVLRDGEIIDEYPEDAPFPSCLVLGVVEGRAIHVVAAVDGESRTCHIITAYPPDPDLWNTGFRRRTTS